MLATLLRAAPLRDSDVMAGRKTLNLAVFKFQGTHGTRDEPAVVMFGRTPALLQSKIFGRVLS
jgi:hypothetical protein